VKVLIKLRDEKGMSTQEIIDKFVFLTAGACGPCRFGMYVTEYRKALRDAGFDGFRVMLFQQQGGLDQATGDASGLDLNPKFFINLLRGLLAGDVINGMGYRIRPYEVTPGATDAVIEQAKKLCYDALYEGRSVLRALWKARALFEAIEIERTRLRPKVAIIGEFWAMTTEGDGNYRLQRFLEEEGAECDIQFVTAWLLYNIWEVKFDTEQRSLLKQSDGGKRGLANLGELEVTKKLVSLWAADKALRVVFQTFANAVGFTGYKLPDMGAIADVAAPYYDNDLRGGEGHMEVGKLILNVVHQKATMTLSVKPFGCMPSSAVSDGVQSLITEKYPGTIFCPVETSGDGAVNFYSRVQMYLFKAKQAVEQEVAAALADTGLTMDQVRAYLAEHRRLGSPLHKPPHARGSTVADTIYEVADRMRTTAPERALRSARSALRSAARAAQRAAGRLPALHAAA
jgi:predicted nucleotide-binding protein (sugar kinase/HSP70/actin superfamily)